MTETFSSKINGIVTDTAVTTKEGVTCFYQLIRESVFDEDTGLFRFAYTCFIVTVANGESSFALVRDISSQRETAESIFSLLVRGSVTSVTVYDVIEDAIT